MIYQIFRNFVAAVSDNPKLTERELIAAGLKDVENAIDYYRIGSASGAISGPYHHLIDQAIEWGAIAWDQEKNCWVKGGFAGTWLSKPAKEAN